jgi:hypothetical protein
MERPSISPPRTPPLKEIYVKNTSSHIGLAIGLSICITVFTAYCLKFIIL